MRKFRLLLAASLMALLVGACSSPTVPPYPSPEDEEPGPDPEPGLVLTQPGG